MMGLGDLPAVNAALNSASALLLTSGYLFVRRGQVRGHRLCMVAAFSTSALFLVSYLTYHFFAGSTPFPHGGSIRAVYFTVLISHTILAALVPLLALLTLTLAIRGRFQSHKRVARWTLPIWLYVSVTGVMVYWMLYRM